MPAIICPHCGVTNRAYSNFCNNCGADVRALPIDGDKRAIETPPETPADEPAPRISQDRGLPDAAELATNPEPAPELEDPESDQTLLELVDSTKSVTERLIPGLQSLLEPHSIDLGLNDASNVEQARREPKPDLPNEKGSIPSAPPETPRFAADRLEDLQAVMSTTPQLENSLILLGKNVGSETLRMPLLFMLLVTLLAVVLILRIGFPLGSVRPLPGVVEAYAAVEELELGANILMLWAYDPAMASEMDDVVDPLLRHLFRKEGQLAVISTLPTGPATARRMWNEVSTAFAATNQTALIDLGFLPGGTATMPILAYTDVPGLLRYGVREYGAGSAFMQFWQQKPDLMLVVASQAEDVQYWLEQVQPINGVRTVAFTSASADPVLRPYRNSGQLSGLVTGFDGAAAYELLLQNEQLEPPATDSTLKLTNASVVNSLLIAQNWGHLILLGILLMGNLSILLDR